MTATGRCWTSSSGWSRSTPSPTTRRSWRCATRLFGERTLVHPRNIGRIMFPENTSYTTPAHQDFIHIRGTPETYTAWIPLGACPRDLGGPVGARGIAQGRAVPGGSRPSAPARSASTRRPLEARGLRWAAADFEIGDALFFHSHAVHKALPNRSPRPDPPFGRLPLPGFLAAGHRGIAAAATSTAWAGTRSTPAGNPRSISTTGTPSTSTPSRPPEHPPRRGRRRRDDNTTGGDEMRRILAVLLATLPGRRSEPGNRPGATFAGGCFWCLEPPFEKLPGVQSVISGVHRGTGVEPHVPRGGRGVERPGHLEAVQVTFDPETISYERLLEVYWMQFDPTDAGGSFVDRGAPVHLGDLRPRRGAAAAGRRPPRRTWPPRAASRTPSSRRVREADVFYPAEEYHQDFYRKDPSHYQALPLRLGARPVHPRPLGRRRRGPRTRYPQAAGEGVAQPPDAAPVRGHPGGGHRAALPQRVLGQQEGGDLRGHRLRRAPLPLRRQVRLGHRVAELHASPGWRRTSSRRGTSSCSTRAPRCAASTATRTWATSSTTDPSPRGCATASTRRPCASSRGGEMEAARVRRVPSPASRRRRRQGREPVTRDEALALMHEHTASEPLRRHMYAVGGPPWPRLRPPPG